MCSLECWPQWSDRRTPRSYWSQPLRNYHHTPYTLFCRHSSSCSLVNNHTLLDSYISLHRCNISSCLRRVYSRSYLFSWRANQATTTLTLPHKDFELLTSDVVVFKEVWGLANWRPFRGVVHLFAVSESHPSLPARHVGHLCDRMRSAEKDTVQIIPHVVGKYAILILVETCFVVLTASPE